MGLFFRVERGSDFPTEPNRGEVSEAPRFSEAHRGEASVALFTEVASEKGVNRGNSLPKVGPNSRGAPQNESI